MEANSLRIDKSRGSNLTSRKFDVLFDWTILMRNTIAISFHELEEVYITFVRDMSNRVACHNEHYFLSSSFYD